MKRRHTFLIVTASAIGLAALHPAPNAPAICYGIVIGAFVTLVIDWANQA